MLIVDTGGEVEDIARHIGVGEVGVVRLVEIITLGDIDILPLELRVIESGLESDAPYTLESLELITNLDTDFEIAVKTDRLLTEESTDTESTLFIKFDGHIGSSQEILGGIVDAEPLQLGAATNTDKVDIA